MRKRNKVKGLIVLVIYIILVPVILSAQVGIQPLMPVHDYIILMNWDTLPGKIKWGLFNYVEKNPVEIKFTPENGATRVFNASEIRGFGNYTKLAKKDFNAPEEYELQNYVSMPSLRKGVPVFMKRLLDGRVRIFQNRGSLGTSTRSTEEGEERPVDDESAFRTSPIDETTISIENSKILSIGPRYETPIRIIEHRSHYTGYIVCKDNETLFKLKKENYDRVFMTLFGDCPEIAKELEKNPVLRKFKNFMVLAEVYDQVCSGFEETP